MDSSKNKLLEPDFWHTATPQDVSEALSKGAEAEACDDKGITPLHYAAGRGRQRESIELLLKQGMDINILDGRGGTPLHWAAALQNKPEIVELLLQRGANVHANEATELTVRQSVLRPESRILHQIGEKLTPLHLAAAYSQSSAVVETLLKGGADINAPSATNDTPLHVAAGFSDARNVVAVLLLHGANINARNEYAQKPLHHAAASSRDPYVVEQLLERDSLDINAVDKWYRTPLHIAAQQSEIPKIMELLLQPRYHADINALDRHQCTPLHVAAQVSQLPQMVELLLDRGADATILDKVGKTAFDYAKENEHLQNNQALLERLQKATVKTPENNPSRNGFWRTIFLPATTSEREYSRSR